MRRREATAHLHSSPVVIVLWSTADPPSTGKVTPVMVRVSSEKRNTDALETSNGPTLQLREVTSVRVAANPRMSVVASGRTGHQATPLSNHISVAGPPVRHS